MQQAQGEKAPDFDYAFNLRYGVQYTGLDEFMAEIRAAIGQKTRRIWSRRGRRIYRQRSRYMFLTAGPGINHKLFRSRLFKLKTPGEIYAHGEGIAVHNHL